MPQSAIRNPLTAFALLSLSLLTGCSTMTNKEVGQIDFNYSVPQQEKDTGKTIIVVAPAMSQSQAAQQPAYNNNPLLMMAMAQQPQPVDFNGIFSQSYQGQLVSALQNTFNEIISKRGFRTTTFSSSDDMTYTDKKSSYLASTPKLNLNIMKKTTKHECDGGFCTEEGVIQISGEMNVSFIEPLTQQAFLNKRINLSDLNISKSYIKQADHPGSGGSGIVGLISAVAKPDVYQDNTDKALVDALNEFYKKSSEKIAAFISREELLSFERDINNVKEIKRF